MQTLNLKKKTKGSYYVNAYDVSIVIENPFICVGMGSNEWQLYIHIKGKVVCTAFFPTKKKANVFAANWVIENL